MLCLPQCSITRLLTKLHKEKEKEKEKEVVIYQKLAPLEALMDQEGWKVYFLKGMYVARLSTLIHVIWLTSSKLTYVAKKLLSLVVLVEHEV